MLKIRVKKCQAVQIYFEGVTLVLPSCFSCLTNVRENISYKLEYQLCPKEKGRAFFPPSFEHKSHLTHTRIRHRFARNFLWSADVNIDGSLHLVILFKSMAYANEHSTLRLKRKRVVSAYASCLTKLVF